VEEWNEEGSHDDRDDASNTERNANRLLIGEGNLGRTTLPEDKESQQEGSEEDCDRKLALSLCHLHRGVLTV
jgi:hypothetical protein